MNRLKFIFVLLFSISFISCNSWLDVSPKGQVDAKKLLKDVNGYNTAINGVYAIMANEDLYGRNLTFGHLDILAQYWNVTQTTNVFYDMQRFNYASANVTPSINTIWGDLYRAIGQCNHILESLEVNGNSIENADLFKGEALALRAFLHFDVLRLYGPVLRSEADFQKPAIPYRTQFDNISIKFSTSKEIIENVRVDFLAALDLLKNDPIKVTGRTGNANESVLAYNSIIDRRGSRMNYFGIVALLSRLELYAGNKTKAYEYATRVIKECEETLIEGYPVMHLTDKDDFDNSSDVQRDAVCSSEMLFSLYVNKLWDNAGNLFGYKDYKSESKKQLSINSTLYSRIVQFLYGRTPDGAGTDFRLKHWFAKIENSTYYEFIKVKKPNQAGGMAPPFYPELALIRLSEIYYIATETQIGVNNIKALEYLNKVRDFRGLAPISSASITDELLMTYLTRECRKEFYGDGQMFHFYKRLFKVIEIGDKVSVAPVESNFVFPIPDDEYEFSPNEKPNTNKN